VADDAAQTDYDEYGFPGFPQSGKGSIMTRPVKFSVAIFALLCVASPTYADSCAPSIARVQGQLDAVIEKRAGGDGWKREGVNATLGRQPTPFSLAATEGEGGTNLQIALESLDRARAADRVGDVSVCRRELASARSILRRYRQK
jgi:hypothetical protein